MKKVLAIIFSFLFMSASHADLENRISEIIAGWIPGEGITEVGVELNDADNDNINFSILGVRSIEKTDDTFLQKHFKNPAFFNNFITKYNFSRIIG